MAGWSAVSPAYPYGNQAMFRAERVEVEPNQLLTVKLKGNDRTFVIPEEAIGSEIGVLGCHGPPRVGKLEPLVILISQLLICASANNAYFARFFLLHFQYP